MPDPIQILEALAASAAVALVVVAAGLLLSGWPRRAPKPGFVNVGAVVGLGVAWFVGCAALGQWPHWPPREGQDRLLFLVLPAVLLVELVSAFPVVPRWLAWLLRILVAAGTARVLLHDTTYLADLAGPGSREWTPAQAWLVLLGLAAALAAVWAAVVLLAERAHGRPLPAALAVTCAGAAIAIMLSGYATGGELGLPLAAALLGISLASLALSGRVEVTGVLGVGLVGLFGLLVIGRFFGQLTTTHAALLLAAPLLCWLPELPYLRKLRPWLRGGLQVALVAIPVAVAVVQAQRQFVQDSRPSSNTTEPSLQDYMDYGR
jgi:hypothetical protein